MTRLGLCICKTKSYYVIIDDDVVIDENSIIEYGKIDSVVSDIIRFVYSKCQNVSICCYYGDRKDSGNAATDMFIYMCINYGLNLSKYNMRVVKHKTQLVNEVKEFYGLEGSDNDLFNYGLALLAAFG